MMRSLTLLLKVNRPLGWVVAPLIFMIGLYYSNDNPGLISLVQLVLLSFPFSIILYGINDVYDYQSDKLNPRKSSLEFGVENKSLIEKSCAGVSVLMLGTSIATLNISNIITTLLLVVIAYYYSAPPIRFKERPPLDSISNGGLFFLVFAL